MMKYLRVCALLGSLFCITPAWAVQVSNLYQVDLPVASHLEEDRIRAAEQGLEGILIRLTGDAEIAKNPVIKAAVKRADYYVHEFSYATPTMSSSTYMIHIGYDKGDVNRLIRKAGVPYWGEKRPSILVWLVMDNASQPMEIVNRDSMGDLFDYMKAQGSKFGLPLLFPIMDVTDLNIIAPDDVVAMKWPALKVASKRYAPKAYLIGNIREVSGGFQGQWSFMMGDRQWGWQLEGKSANDVIDGVFSQISQMLVRRYEVKSL